jgi:hypothetical protein
VVNGLLMVQFDMVDMLRKKKKRFQRRRSERKSLGKTLEILRFDRMRVFALVLRHRFEKKSCKKLADLRPKEGFYSIGTILLGKVCRSGQFHSDVNNLNFDILTVFNLKSTI